MNRVRRNWQLWITLAMALTSTQGPSAEQALTVVHPRDTGAALTNPAMGWGFHYYSKNDDFVSQDRGPSSIEYACRQGLTLRDDSILVQLYLQAVEDYHASYVSVHWRPQEFLDENRELIGRINLRLGYRLQLVQASWPSEVAMDSTVRFSAKWRNAGVAPCLPGGYPALTLKDSKGGIVGVFVDDKFDVRSLPVGPPGKAEALAQEMTFPLSRLLHSNYRPGVRQPGSYDLYVSVGTRTGTPRFALPLPDGDGNRRYRLGALKVIPDIKK